MRGFEWWSNRLNQTTAREDGKEKVNSLERIEVLSRRGSDLADAIDKGLIFDVDTAST